VLYVLFGIFDHGMFAFVLPHLPFVGAGQHHGDTVVTLRNVL